MRSVVSLPVIVVLASFAAPVFADAAMLKKYNCMACHAVAKKVLGPSFQDVATKYKDDPEAAQRLAAKILAGGGGVWGELAMPAQTQVPEDVAPELANYILSLEPAE